MLPPARNFSRRRSPEGKQEAEKFYFDAIISIKFTHLNYEINSNNNIINLKL